jgi:biotin carboxylase
VRLLALVTPPASFDMSVRAKRLLILGGNPETGALVRHANSMGVVTIVVDPNPDAPAKRDAAERYDVDGRDVPALVSLARRVRADGVLVGVADVLVGAYREVCEALHFPCYANARTVDAFTTKDGFQLACRTFGVECIPAFTLDASLAKSDVDALRYPIMLKPVDNGGGVGMIVCESSDDLASGIAFALRHSKRGAFVAERYMQCDDVFAYYTFKDGEVFLSAMADRITTRVQGKTSPVCIAASYPSKYLDAYLATVHPKMCRMFEGLGVRDGVLNVQFFVDGADFFAYDPGFRLQGEAPHIVINAVNGFDHRSMLIEFALTGRMGTADLISANDPRLRGNRACTVWLLLKEGTIDRIDGLDALRLDPSVVFVLQRFSEGDAVLQDMVGTERQVLARVYVVANSDRALAAKVAEIHRIVQVTDITGHDMLVDRVDADQLRTTPEGESQ